MDMAFVFDTETTGLVENRLRKIERQSEIIEFYGCSVDLDTGTVYGEFETLIKPQAYPMSKDTIEKTKTMLTNEMLADARHFTNVADEMRKWLEGGPKVIAHNAAFDREIVDIEMERVGRNVFWPQVVCTIEQTMHMKGFRLSLTNLHKELFSEEFVGAHRAKNDVQALVRCCVELRKRGDL